MKEKKKIKVVIIQGYNTPYRNELFNRISEYADVDLTLLYVSKQGADRQWKDKLVPKFKEGSVRCSVSQTNYIETNTRLNPFDYALKILQIKPDVVISQLGKLTIPIRYLLFWKKMALIHWSEATLVKACYRNWFDKTYLQMHKRLPAAYLFPGKLSLDYHRWCGLNLDSKVFFAPNSVDDVYRISDDEIKQKFSNMPPLKFLFIGSFVEVKGFHLVNAIFNRLRFEKYHLEFHVAGDGPIRPAEGIVNHGYVTKEKAIRLYKDCHVFVMPSLSDCNPLAVIEAAKTGNVLIISKGAGNYPEMVNGNGFVFEIGSEEGLLEKCHRVLGTPMEEMLEMGMKSVELASGITHWNTAKAFHEAIKFAVYGKP